MGFFYEETEVQVPYGCKLNLSLPGCHSVDCHVEDLPWPDDGEESVDALEDGHHHLVLVLGGRLVLGVSAGVDDSVHVQVKVVELNLMGTKDIERHGMSYCRDLELIAVLQALFRTFRKTQGKNDLSKSAPS